MTVTYTNNLVFDCATCYGTKTNGTYSKCAATDATGSEAGLNSLTRAQLAFWNENDNGCFDAGYGILTTSVLYQAGADTADTTDIKGNARHATTPNIGAYEGTVNAFGVAWPTAGQVEAGVSFQTFAAAVLGTAEASSQSSASEQSVSESSASEQSISESSASEQSVSESSASEQSVSQSSASDIFSSASESSASESTASSVSASSASSATSASSSESGSASSGSSSESGDATVAANDWEMYIRAKNETVTMEAATKSKSATGAVVYGWTPGATLYADVQDPSSETRNVYQMRQLRVTHSVYVAVDPAASEGDRLDYGGVKCLIQGVKQLDPGKLWRLDVEVLK